MIQSSITSRIMTSPTSTFTFTLAARRYYYGGCGGPVEARSPYII